MRRKKRVLFVTESHQLASGFGVYGKEVLERLHKTGKYELAEFACYCNPQSVENTDWLTYGVAPMAGEDAYAKEHTDQPQVQWGIVRFERVCMDFKPDIVITYRDPWMDAYIADSPFLPLFHWVWMPTIDSEPQKLEWLYQLFNRCDGLLAYSEFGIKVLDQQTKGRIKPVGCASPAIDPNFFNMIPNKESHKQQFGLDPDSFIVGTLMRNQKRKMFPDLMKAFKQFLDQAPKEIAKKAFLYLHTSYPEKHGWELTSLVHEYGLGSKVLCTYKCRGCGKFFPCHYRDAITVCRFCKNHSAVMPGVSTGVSREELVQIYNLMDCYVQYAICLGKDEPILIKRNGEEQWCPISQVKIGDESWTHRSRWKPISEVWKNLAKSHNDKILKVTAYGDYESVIATEGHEFLAYTKKEIHHDKSRSVREKIGDKLRGGSKIPEPGRHELGDLINGDMLAYPIDDTVEDIQTIDLSQEIDDSYIVTDDYIEVRGGYTYPRYLNVDNDVCKFIGLFAADGSASSKGLCRITSNVHEKSNHALANIGFDKLRSTENNSHPRLYNDRKGRDDHLYSSLHHDIFYKWFDTKENKQLPSWCMKLPVEKQKQIVIGMFMGDGHYCEEKNYSQYSTTAKKLAEQLKTLLRRLRISFSVCKIERSKHNTKDQRNRQDSYSFEIYGCNIKKGEFCTTRNGTNNVYYKNYHLLKIKSIKESDYKGDVWCITVKDDHTFTTLLGATTNCEGFGMPQVEAAACGVPVLAIDYSAMEDVVRYVKGVPITANLSRELETSADRSGPNNDELSATLLRLARQDKSRAKRHRLETRKGCIDRYTWDNAAKAWENYLDKVEPKGMEGQWNAPSMIAKPPESIPEGMTNHQFSEWVCTCLIQDQYSAFSHRMLLISRNLNFGAEFGQGFIKSCTQESVFKDNMPLAQRRFLFDALRSGNAQEQPQQFIAEAHRRLKK